MLGYGNQRGVAYPWNICTIQATQAGDSSYLPAPAVSQSFQYSHQGQTIGFPVIPTQVIGATITLNATVSSGLPVIYASTTPSVCTVSGNSATMNATGYCGISATQPGNNDIWEAVAGHMFLVTLAPQTITFVNPGTQTYGEAAFTVNATASSGLTVTLASTTPLVCTVLGTTVTLIAPGYCSMVATQAGNSYYAVAPVAGNFPGHSSAANHYVCEPGHAALRYATHVNCHGELRIGGQLRFHHYAGLHGFGKYGDLCESGTCGIVASQPGNSNYAAAPAVGHAFAVLQGARPLRSRIRARRRLEQSLR